jgi:hypothetical protein
MPDTSEPTASIRHLISTGATERDLLAAVARKFPELTRTEFLAALQDATEAAQRQAARRH